MFVKSMCSLFVSFQIMAASIECDNAFLESRVGLLYSKIWQGIEIPSETIRNSLGFISDETQFKKEYSKEKYLALEKEIQSFDPLLDGFIKNCSDIYHLGSELNKIELSIVLEELCKELEKNAYEYRLKKIEEGNHPFRAVDYEEAFGEEKFSGPSLGDVTEIFTISDEYQLTDEQKQKLCSSATLKNLKVIDLSNQGIDDDFMSKICKNPTFSRVIKLDLSGNKKLTDQTLKLISESQFLGSIRDLPQISSRYGKPSSEIHINVKDTSISPRAISQFNREPQNRDFVIRYLHPVTDQETSLPATGIKWLQIEK